MAKKYYTITMELQLNEDAGHPRKWVAEAISENLEPGEDILEINFEEMTQPSE